MMTPEEERFYTLGQVRALVMFAGELLRQANRRMPPGGGPFPAEAVHACHQLLIAGADTADRAFHKIGELLP